MINWITAQFGRIKTIAVIVLIALAAFAWVQKRAEQRKVIDLTRSTTILETENYMLEKEREEALSKVKFYKGRIAFHVEAVKVSHEARHVLKLELQEVSKERDALREEVKKRTANSLYEDLLKAFPFPGVKKYPFNGIQIEEIYVLNEDYKYTKEENMILYEDISECDLQLTLKDSTIYAALQSMELLEHAGKADSDIILNHEAQDELNQGEIKRLKRKMFFTKIGSGIIAGLGILVGVAIAL